MNDSSERLLAAFSRAAAEGKPVFVLDGQKRCLLSGCRERLAQGECIDDLLLPPKEQTGSCYEGSLCRFGMMYCVRYIEADGLYMGEILSANEVSFISEYTDRMSSHAAMYSSMEYELAAVWKSKHALEQLLSESSEEVRELIRRMERPLYRVSAGSRNVYEYLSMMYSARRNTVVDMARMCRELVIRCNESLSACGRHVELRLPQDEKLYIRADIRHAVAAVLNAVQNALLYSPKATVPLLEVRRSGRRILITTENENSRVSDAAAAVCVMRGGYGIPIIRRFAALSGGELNMSLEADIAVVRMDIPAATDEEIAEYALEEAVLYRFEDGAPDYVQLQMMIVEDMYESGEMTGNIQYSVT